MRHLISGLVAAVAVMAAAPAMACGYNPCGQPLALVLGAEGKGLRHLTRETCSVVARLDMPGEIKSLNVSNAAVLALYIGASRLGLM